MDTAPVAWVESPLQLIGAAEWAAARRQRIVVAGRLTPQMSETADALVARGAWFGRMEPYLGIPWKLISAYRHWLVGDGFSGQFRLAAAVLRPRAITFLDDGAHCIPLADSILGAREYARPDAVERRLATLATPFALENTLRRARAGHAGFFTAFDLGVRRTGALADRGFRIEPHAFAWTRETARPDVELGERIVLGSARPVDGRMSLPAYLAWVAARTSDGPVTYLPHRRETPEQLAAVASLPGVRIVTSRLPVELVLAGADRRMEIFTLPSSTTTTLPLVLGDGATLHSVAAGSEAAA